MARTIRVRRGMRRIDGLVYHRLRSGDTKARAQKEVEEYRVGGYGARVIKEKDGWSVYRTWEKIRKAIKKPKSWWRKRGYVTR